MKTTEKLTQREIALLAIYEALCLVVAVVCAPLVALAVRWDDGYSTFSGGDDLPQYPRVRGDLPWWLSWFQTFDERMPCGIYEPTMRAFLDRYGQYLCSVRWLIRNRMFGLSKALFGQEVEKDTPLVYMMTFKGPLMFGAGWKRYRATTTARHDTGPFVAIPSVTVRLRKNG